MPLVTYTEGMPEFLEHQDTLCIRRRGTERYVKQAPKNARLTSRFAPKLADGKCVKKKCLTMLKFDFVTIIVWWIDYNRCIKTACSNKRSSSKADVKTPSIRRGPVKDGVNWKGPKSKYYILHNLAWFIRMIECKCRQVVIYVCKINNSAGTLVQTLLKYEQYVSTAVLAHCNPLVKSATQHPLKFALKKWVGP